MKLKTVETKNAPAAIGPYSQAVIHKDLMFISGQIPADPATGKLVSEDVAEQTRQCIENAKAIAAEAGATLDNVVKATVFTTDLSKFSVINEVYGQYFSSHKPARACVEVSRLPRDVKVEIEMVVALND